MKQPCRATDQDDCDSTDPEKTGGCKCSGHHSDPENTFRFYDFIGQADYHVCDNGSYAGYHVMYFVGEGEQYSDYLAKNSLLTTDMNAWLEELTSAYETSVGGGIRFVGK